MTTIRFRVPDARPSPQGSKTAFAMKDKRTGKHRAIMVETSKGLKPYRKAVTIAAKQVAPAEPITSPVSLTIHFIFERPKSHFTSKGVLKASAPPRPTGRIGDLSKLIRAVEDAITDAGVWTDDRLVTTLSASKSYGNTNLTNVMVMTL